MFADWKPNRRHFLQAGAFALAALRSSISDIGASASAGTASILSQPLKEFNYNEVQFADGLHQRQLDDTMNVLLGLSEDSLLKPFRLRAGLPAPGDDLGGWYDEDPKYGLNTGSEHGFAPGHSFGQWISALVRYHAINGSQPAKDKAERLISLYEKTISPKFYESFRWPTYTYDKINLALTDAHHFLGLKDAFPILEKTTNTAEPFFPARALDHDEMRTLPHKDESFCWDESYTLPENFFIAFNRGAGDRYKQLAVRFLKDDTYFNPLSEGKNVLPDHHAYSYTNALSSAMQAYLTIGSEKHLKAATNAFDMIKNTQSFATGGWGPDESFRKPDSNDMFDSLTNTHHSFETPCGSYAHFKLTRYLLRVSANSKYGDSMEQVMYNTVLGSKKLEPDGRAFYYSDYNFNGQKGYREKWTCCSGTLPQVATDYRISTYFQDADGLYVNLYIPSTLTWTRTSPDSTAIDSAAKDSAAKDAGTRNSGATIKISQKSNYPLDGQIEFTVTSSHPSEFAIHFRIPDWADGATLTLNGKKVPTNELTKSATAGGFACITRRWDGTEKVELDLPMRIRLSELDARHPNIVAIQRGPLVLFPITPTKPQATKEQLLNVKRQSKDEWTIQIANENLRLLPFTSFNDEKYSTYFELIH